MNFVQVETDKLELQQPSSGEHSPTMLIEQEALTDNPHLPGKDNMALQIWQNFELWQAISP